MICGDIEELAPLWHSGELDGARQAAFDAHVATCQECAGSLREQKAADAHLRKALASEHVDTRALDQQIMRQIARERFRRWVMTGTAVAAVAVAAVALASVNRRAPMNPAIFADAARDHRTEIMEHRPRRWRTEPADIAAIETSQKISDVDVKAIEATGYHLRQAKICGLGGSPYVHLVYAKDGHEFSVYMKARTGQALPDEKSNTGDLQLASFARGRVQAVVVSDASRAECERFARAAEKAL
jgi:anti-sigma factor RsiW